MKAACLPLIITNAKSLFTFAERNPQIDLNER